MYIHAYLCLSDATKRHSSMQWTRGELPHAIGQMNPSTTPTPIDHTHLQGNTPTLWYT